MRKNFFGRIPKFYQVHHIANLETQMVHTFEKHCYVKELT